MLYKSTFTYYLLTIRVLFFKVESLFEDEDFRVKVTREQFEELCQDLVDRIDKVIRDALATAELTKVRERC